MQAGLTNSLGFSVEGSEIQGDRQLRAKLALGFSRGNIGHGVCKQTRTHTEPRRRVGGGNERARYIHIYIHIYIDGQIENETENKGNLPCVD